jgi:hypothetical protein
VCTIPNLDGARGDFLRIGGLAAHYTVRTTIDGRSHPPQSFIWTNHSEYYQIVVLDFPGQVDTATQAGKVFEPESGSKVNKVDRTKCEVGNSALRPSGRRSAIGSRGREQRPPQTVSTFFSLPAASIPRVW